MGFTPMIEQYLKIKSKYQDSFLFFRLGDFYEMFFEDAKKAALELEITLTSRDGGSDERIPMCGVPHHSAQGYIKRLIEKGFKVAICEQVEDPKIAKGVVKREVVQHITPGTVMEGSMLDEKENNYLATIHFINEENFGLAYTDLSTGETITAIVEDGWHAVITEIANRPIKEIVLKEDFPDQLRSELKERYQFTISELEEEFEIESQKALLSSLTNDNLKRTCNHLFSYMFYTQKRSIDHLRPAQEIELKEYMALDLYSKRNLEITNSLIRNEKYGSLLWILDKTVTAMGARKLKKWMERPLLSKNQIEKRLTVVEGFQQQFFERQTLREHLTAIYDMERLAGRVSYGNVHAKDLVQLKNSISRIPSLKEILNQFSNKEIMALSEKIDPLPALFEILDKSISDDPSLSIKEGNIIKDGYNEQLDQYRYASRNGKQWIAELEKKEKEKTKIKSLKIGYNRVFGYYIEVTKANLHLLPEGMYERKQTLTNAERYITPELKEKESLILEAEEKSIELEYELFLKIRDQVRGYISQLQELADIISEIDVLQSFATISEENNYVKPNFSTNKVVQIEKCRHPVVEKVMKNGHFVPNDINMDKEKELLLITGPNMSGKSTYMRQFALTVIMAQIGCFVPCEKAVLPLFDQIFTRIGAADDLVAGQSTFMIEMLEANNAIQHATSDSLILFDEIGRGTSTYDGMALAQAIIEHLHHHVQAKTLFSTHYHELTSLEDNLERLKNIHVEAEEIDGKVVFLHQIQDGAADESYGIHVAKLASLPDELIDRASVILKELEGSNKGKIKESEALDQLSFFPADEKKSKQPMPKAANSKTVEAILKLNILEMTPMDALNELYQIQKKLKE
ncbi:DNA mismatch repair protein MutS [Saliterribacillus persicus]|uniref:DNA mismatch repair protein MutS n=1 Tax=Saliterribacillus persicus TaxID=930114 RepID=A0A368XRP8_9BACI|nr:DNA mismatch repair protein MutS [Saliterribacillus persicus]RCW70641.1 DNA mismatch repair protein MutS [Saliterribacillus persicus]